MPAATVVLSGVAKFKVTTPADAVADEMAIALGPKMAGAETVADEDAAVNPPIASTPTIWYVIV